MTGSSQLTPSARRILWLAVGQAAPLAYAIAALAVSASGYRPILELSSVLQVALLLLAPVPVGVAFLYRERVRALPLGDPRYMIALVTVDAMGVLGLMVYLLLGPLAVAMAICVLALIAGFLLRPRDVL